MDSTLLRAFLHHSREWSRAERGLELFRMASIDLQRFTDADTGFFVYRKRFGPQGEAHAVQPTVYVPWGSCANDEQQLQQLVDDVMAVPGQVTPFMERWVDVDEAPTRMYQAWQVYGLAYFGIWPLVSRERAVGAIVVAQTRTAPKMLSDVTRLALLDTAGAQVSLAMDLLSMRRIAEETSQRDLLTGVLNRRGLEAVFPEMLRRARAEGHHLVLGLVDLDDLKGINDTYGHPAGDTALQYVSDAIMNTVRSNDAVARIGGDEFIVVLVSDTADPLLPMQRIQHAVEHGQSEYRVSVGAAVWNTDGETMDALYRVADERLYACKRSRSRA